MTALIDSDYPASEYERNKKPKGDQMSTMTLQDATREVATRCANDEKAWAAWLVLHAHLRREVKVPDVAVWSDAPREFGGVQSRAWSNGWNACREAYLAAAPTSVATDGQGVEVES